METLRAKLSSGRIVEMRPLTCREQIGADRASNGEPAKIAYYRTAHALTSIDDEPLQEAKSQTNLDRVIDKFQGSEFDECMDIFKLNFSPFVAVLLRDGFEESSNLFQSAQLGEFRTIIEKLVLKDESNGQYICPLSSGRKVQIRPLTARQQMNADSWSSGDPILRNYARTAMAIARVNNEDIPVPGDIASLDGRLADFMGLEFDEITVVFGLKFATTAEILKNLPSPQLEGSSPTS